MNILTRLGRRRFPHTPLITVELSKSRLLHNLERFRRMGPGLVAPVLKSNAYGHGLFEIASMLSREKNIPFFVVDSYFEAVALRARGIKTPLLVIGYVRPENIIESRLKNVAFAVTSLETLEAIKNGIATRGAGSFSQFFSGRFFGKKDIHIHLKIDTGMRRQGIFPEAIDQTIAVIQKLPRVHLDGICSHLPDADNPENEKKGEKSFTNQQIALWNTIARKFKKYFPDMRYIHLSNTDGHHYTNKIEATVARLGNGLYGLSDNEIVARQLDLKPILEMKTILTITKKVKKGEAIGYNGTFVARQDMTIGTIPGGYFEGMDRRLSNNGFLLVGPSRVPCPIVGRISMNITTIDVSKVDGAAIGTSVVIISNVASDENSFFSIAKKCGAITYEIAVHIPAHLRRVVVE